MIKKDLYMEKEKKVNNHGFSYLYIKFELYCNETRNAHQDSGT